MSTTNTVLSTSNAAKASDAIQVRFCTLLRDFEENPETTLSEMADRTGINYGAAISTLSRYSPVVKNILIQNGFRKRKRKIAPTYRQGNKLTQSLPVNGQRLSKAGMKRLAKYWLGAPQAISLDDALQRIELASKGVSFARIGELQGVQAQSISQWFDRHFAGVR